MALSLKTTSGKVLASAALVATAAGAASLGTYGDWTTTTNASQAVVVGTVAISLGADGTPNNLSVPISGVLPGDRIERLVTLSSGTADLGSVTLTTSAGLPASALTTDTTNGLQLTVESCSQPWSGSSAPYTCDAPGAAKKTVLASGPIIGVNRSLTGLNALKAEGKDYLKFSAVLPGTAPGSFQGAASTVTFAFTATQRAATTL